MNWEFNNIEVLSLEDMPLNTIGFIYQIDNLSTGKYYIGRKTVASVKKKKLTIKEKLLPENKRKTFKYVFSETPGWKKYTGSNLTLKAEVDRGDKIKKTILCFCQSKACLTYKETEAIICSGSLLDPKSYNDWVSCKVYKKHL